MKNWEKLKNSLVSCLNSMSKEDWIEWKNKEDEQREIQFAQKKMEALLLSLKTSLTQFIFSESEVLRQSILPDENLFYVEKVDVNDNTSSENDVLSIFSFAA